MSKKRTNPMQNDVLIPKRVRIHLLTHFRYKLAQMKLGLITTLPYPQLLNKISSPLKTNIPPTNDNKKFFPNFNSKRKLLLLTQTSKTSTLTRVPLRRNSLSKTMNYLFIRPTPPPKSVSPQKIGAFKQTPLQTMTGLSPGIGMMPSFFGQSPNQMYGGYSPSPTYHHQNMGMPPN